MINAAILRYQREVKYVLFHSRFCLFLVMCYAAKRKRTSASESRRTLVKLRDKKLNSLQDDVTLAADKNLVSYSS